MPGSHPIPWDGYDAYLFDIDGTLLQCEDATHYFAFCHALTKVADRSMNLDGITVHGNTDVGILRDAFLLAQIPETCWRPIRDQILDEMCAFVDERVNELHVTTMAGVVRALHHLHQQGAIIGIATGNLEKIGRLKLLKAGLTSFVEVESYSDAWETRSEVFAAGVEKLVTIFPRGVPSICIIGDTPEDVRAARHNGVHSLAVSTGIYSIGSLLEAFPTRCVKSLEHLF